MPEREMDFTLFRMNADLVYLRWMFFIRGIFILIAVMFLACFCRAVFLIRASFFLELLSFDRALLNQKFFLSVGSAVFVK